MPDAIASAYSLLTMSVLLVGVVETVPDVIFAVVMFAVLAPSVPMSNKVTADPAASKYTALSAGYVQNTFFVPAAKFTRLPELLDSKTVVRLRVVPEAVYVPIPTSQSPATGSLMA
jgi:hypothetical protein